MTDLRTLRHRGRQSVELTPGVRLYADSITFTDHRKRTGVADGSVFLDVSPGVRYEWMVEHGYAGRATFDKRNDFVVLGDMPMLEREMMTMIATGPCTTISLCWRDLMVDINVSGPTRTDFAKSHPIPPGIALPQVKLPPGPPRQPLPARGFGKH